MGEKHQNVCTKQLIDDPRTNPHLTAERESIKKQSFGIPRKTRENEQTMKRQEDEVEMVAPSSAVI